MENDIVIKALVFHHWQATLPEIHRTKINKWLDNICAKTELNYLEARALLAEVFCLVAK